MNNSEDTKQRFEILKMAQEMLNQKYTFKRATEHNKWLAESQDIWAKHKKIIPHPAFDPYPTELEVLAAANVLYNFIYDTTVLSEVREEISIVKEQHDVEIPTKELVPEVIKVSKLVEKKIKDAVTDSELSAEPADKDIVKSLLPGWIRRPK